MSTGVCLDATNPGGAPTIAHLRDLGVTLVRMQARHDLQMYRYHNDLKAAGFQTAVVLDRDAYPEIEEHALMIRPTYWVVCNEEDALLLPEPSPSSWGMPVEEFAALFIYSADAIRQRQPEAQVLIGGLVSGIPTWLSDWGTLPADGITVHPYSKDVHAARSLIREYKRLYGLPVYVFEWNRGASEIPDYQAMLDQETAGSAFFCYSDAMVDGFGLTDYDWVPWPEYHALKAASKGVLVMAGLKEAEQAEDWALGAPWKPEDAPNHIDQWTADEEYGRYEFGVAYRKGSSIWQLPHVGPGGKFRLVPA